MTHRADSGKRLQGHFGQGAQLFWCRSVIWTSISPSAKSPNSDL